MNTVPLTVSHVDFFFFLSITKGEGCLLNKRKRKEQRKMICDFLVYKQFPNRKASTS